MHVPDGFLDATTSAATAAVAAGAVGAALQRSGQEVREAGAPLAGLTAAFVFAAQTVNFPVGAGTSGHLVGGALAVALVGPWTAVLCMTVVLAVQALLFADGGLTALGTNVLLLAVVAVVAAALVQRAVLSVLPRRPRSAVPAAAAAGLVSVPAAALAFTGLYAIGGAVPVPVGALALAMGGWHLVIGLGEAVITASVVAAVVATRPDLVHAARHLRPDLVLVDAAGVRSTVTASAAAHPAAHPAAPARAALPLATGLAVTAVVAGLAGLVASTSPDGLERVSAVLGFDAAAASPLTAASPLADYALRGVTSPAVATGLAGVAGVLVTVLLALAAASASRSLRARRGARG
ncbi:energy-coupling factor ABC transporter permease [Quadrisphaera sp. DSM 44207]|uniref:energy-coupling factor ABC transporter permease n=1 Tax=Quadrisphaera sp. DSM 44207 TaxID=1881057 RepID=UPI0008803970|nr:energy-coupling factor ABC transporter permease [Quadrisphaera sp. DSM 44207]SDQ07333.1 cobalt/nickel transport system permease protein [Quadrisphaera sp. DSM 44207]